MRGRRLFETAVLVACLALEGLPLQAQDELKPQDWQYAMLTLRSSMEVARGSQEPYKEQQVIKKAIEIWLESPDPGKSMRHFFTDESAGQTLDRPLPSFYGHIDAFYHKATGTRLPEKERDTPSVLPVLKVLGESAWELVTLSEQEDRAPNAISRQWVFYLKRPRR